MGDSTVMEWPRPLTDREQRYFSAAALEQWAVDVEWHDPTTCTLTGDPRAIEALTLLWRASRALASMYAARAVVTASEPGEA